MREKGLILKGIGGFYTVLLDSGEEIVCKARGRFRTEGMVPVSGDTVLITRQQEGEAAIDEILPRTNALIRPPVANIDQILIVLSVSVPKPDLLLADKLMLAASCYGIEPLLVFNKCDTADHENALLLEKQYAPHYRTFIVSAHSGAGLSALFSELEGKISCFAGQSAVGKSSLLNALLPELHLPVGNLAKKTARGKHTTRHVELWPYKGGAVLDTPGFSLLELKRMEQEELNRGYREFARAAERCRFASCSHRSEPDCAVKELIGHSLSLERYERYTQIAAQMEEMKRRMYD